MVDVSPSPIRHRGRSLCMEWAPPPLLPYMCTSDKDHGGDHVATDGKGEVARWPRS